MAPVPAGLATALQDRYRLDRELGQGGMATVFLARDLRHDRDVALKVLRPELARVLGPERFLTEIRLTAQLDHPHILTLIDSGESDGFLWYVVPFIRGQSLRQKLEREKQLGLEEALAIARQIAGALDYAHRQGVIHRDIKPENILLQEGEAVLADFGIALAVQEAGGNRLTESGLSLGTPQYMSPEQASAQRDLDGRSDVYSLGAVLYEMLAGEPPFTGVSAQAVIAKLMTTHPTPLRTLRDRVPESVDAAVARALAKVPADRFGRPAELAAALGTDEALPPPKPARIEPYAARLLRASPRRLVDWALAIVVVLIGAFFWSRSRQPKAPTLDADLIAIAPFDVHGPELDAWREGLVEYLSRSLDGAGRLRTVSPSQFVRSWSGPSDPASARALGRRTGAGLVVFGSLISGGLDSVRLSASLLDVAGNGAPATVEVRGERSGMDRLADTLAVGLLQALGRTRSIGAVRDAPFGHAPLPALKEFLQGEQMYRRSEWDSALAHYNRAIALDSTLALAYLRMEQVLGWSPKTAQNFEPEETFLLRAVALNHGLALRDSLLIEANDLRGENTEIGYFAVHRHLFATVEEAARRYPADPEFWLALGEVRVHHGHTLATAREALDAFARAIALDSGFAPAYEHVIPLALEVGGADLARHYSRAYMALDSAQANDQAIRVEAALLDPGRPKAATVARQVEALTASQLWRVGFSDLGGWADSAETAVRLMRSLGAGGHSVAGGVEWATDSLMWPQYLSVALIFRGHLHEGYQVYARRPLRPGPEPWYAGWADPFAYLALLGVVPPDSVAERLERTVIPGEGYQEGALAWWLARGDTAQLARFVARAQRAAHVDPDPLDRLRARYQEAVSQAYRALVRRDSAEALRLLSALPDSLCMVTACFFQKLTQARPLAATGDDTRAAVIYDRWRFGTASPNPFWIIATLERGELAERRGEGAIAIGAYQFVVDAWRHADPDLASYVARARAGLQRLVPR